MQGTVDYTRVMILEEKSACKPDRAGLQRWQGLRPPLPALRARAAGPHPLVLDDGVVAGAAVEDILPWPAEEHVVPGATLDGVGPATADQDVVALATVLGELDHARL